MATPAPHNYGSFSYKVTDQRIQNILRARSKVSNVVQIGMPFVKATSTVEIPELLGGSGNVGFTIGIHGLLDAGYESIYAQGNTEAPLVGYTYTSQGNSQPIYAQVPTTTQQIAKYFTQQLTLQDTTNSFNKTAPPGITGLTIGTNRSGLSLTAELQISVPSLQQLEFLNRVFLIPGCGMVVEWGQQFASDKEASLGERGLIGNIQQKMFPWYDRGRLDTLLTRLGKREVGLEEILKNYVYETEGQYMWMFGRVANIGTKGNADGSFDVTVTLKGPAEDQWAYSIRQTAFSNVAPGTTICPDSGNSIESYLTNTTPTSFNLKTLLDGIVDLAENNATGGIQELIGWNGHVIKIDKGNKKDGVEGQDSEANTNESSFADVDNAYFMTWRFFVNVVLNHPQYGIRAIFNKANLPVEIIDKMGILRPYSETGRIDYNVSGQDIINDPYENYVGNNAWLRSYDPGTVIIVNEYAGSEAQLLFEQSARVTPPSDPNSTNLLNPTTSGWTLLTKSQLNETTAKLSRGDIINKTAGNFDFLKSSGQAIADTDRGFLSTGVWLNHKAVITSLLSGNTLMEGISNLLGKMNNATKNYWALTLDVSEPIKEGDKFDYSVVDQNYRGSSESAVSELIEGENKIYTFNKFLRNTSQGPVGSELLEFNVDLDLPKLLFSQIATMGISQSDDEQAAQPTSRLLQPCANPSISDANDTLRRMVGIATISPGRGGKSIDKTNISTQRVPGQCGSPKLGNLPAGTSGQGLQAVTATETDTDQAKNYIEAQQRAQTFLANPKNECDKCTVCYQPLPTNLVPLESGQQAAGNPSIVKPSFRTNGRNVPRVVTRVTFEETFQELQRLGCSDTLILTTMATMLIEQPWSDNGQRKGYRASNYNFAGVDVTNADWTYDPAYHNGYIYLKEGGTGYIKAFASFVDLQASLYFKASKLMQPSRSVTINGKTIKFDQPERMTPEEYATLYYVKWNGLGYRTLNKQLYADSTATQKNEFPSQRFAADDAKGMAGAKSAYNFIVSQFGSRLTGRKTTNLVKRTAPPATAAPPRAAAAPPQPSPTNPCNDELKEKCKQCITANDEFRQNGILARDTRVVDNAAATLTRDFPNLNVALRYIEVVPDRMTALIRCASDGNKANAFGTSPTSLSIKAQLKLPGIAGLRVGELFWIDRMPAFYKIFGAFQVMSMQQEIGQDGWKTNISAQFNNLGNVWKNTTLNLLAKEGIEVKGF